VGESREMSSGWRQPVQVNKCPRCDKTVYANEAKLAAGRKWHTLCFKCGRYKRAVAAWRSG